MVRFGTFEFDAASGELRKQGRRVPLQSQPALVLAQLLSRPGQLVTREELRRTIWSDDTFVDFDAALNVAVNKVRQALHDSASAPRFIETIPRRGYRFLADVHAGERAPGEPATASAPPPSDPFPRHVTGRLRVVVVAVGVLATAVLALSNAPRRSPDSPAALRSLAVLPFRPLAAGSGDLALEVGLTEAVIVRLGRMPRLRVPSINAVQRYARLETDPREAGRELDVEAVLEGSLLRRDANVRLSARLLEVESGATLWAHQWDFPWTDIFSVQDAMAAEVSRTLALSLRSEDQRALRTHPTNLAAYERYLRARYLLLRRTLADSRRATELLEEAVTLDPESAAAHATLAFALISIPLLEGPTHPFVERGRAAARRALDLDPTAAEAHAVLGRILIHFDWNAEAAHREMRRALQLDPDNAFVLHCYSLILADEGRFDEALALADRALAQDPVSVLANRDKALILFLARRYHEAIDQARKALEVDRHAPFVPFILGRSLEQLNRPAEAARAYLAGLADVDDGGRWAALRAAAERHGMKGFWRQRLEQLLQEAEVRTFSVASAYARLGDRERALAWLEKLYAERGAWIRALRSDPDWDPLRADPRFQDLLARAGMAPPPVQRPSRSRASR